MIGWGQLEALTRPGVTALDPPPAAALSNEVWPKFAVLAQFSRDLACASINHPRLHFTTPGSFRSSPQHHHFLSHFLTFTLFNVNVMIFASLAVLSTAVAAVSAAPALEARQYAPGPQCAGLGYSAFDIAYNFTLAALNTTGTPANDTGVPLVLGQAGAIDGAEFKVFSVRHS